MIHAKWLRKVSFVAALGALLVQGCRKENGIDNNNVIRTPYSLYFSDNKGAVFNTNNGQDYKIIHHPDGYAVRSFITSGSNLLFVKKNLHLSIDDGENFNPVDSFINPASATQSLALDVPSHGRIYVSSTKGLGVIYSENNGKTWQIDTAWDYDNIPSTPFPNSFAQLKNGNLFAFSNIRQKLYRRTSKTTRWYEVNKNGLPLHDYFISRMNDALIATDLSGIEGIYFSNDEGQNWTKYNGLPTGIPINATYAAFDQTMLAGTVGYGVYRLQNGTFVPSNNGIDINTTVYSITAKSDTYKNEIVKAYIYIGCNTGLYRSEDGGQNWIKMQKADIQRVF